MSWDAVQRETLDALGHTVYVAVAPTLPALPDDALLRAVLHAASCDAASADAHALWRMCGPMDALRQPVAKRTLWPHLRRLRSVRAP